MTAPARAGTPRIGVDLLSIARFAPIARHRRFPAVLFTEAELDQAGSLGDGRRTEWLAGRFCAKEAVCKVLGRGFGQGLGWRDVEVGRDRWGAPQVTLHRGAREIAARAGLGGLTVTLTHQADLVVAVAVAVAAPGRPVRDAVRRARRSARPA